jgi:hypothetical protein
MVTEVHYGGTHGFLFNADQYCSFRRPRKRIASSLLFVAPTKPPTLWYAAPMKLDHHPRAAMANEQGALAEERTGFFSTPTNIVHFADLERGLLARCYWSSQLMTCGQ